MSVLTDKEEICSPLWEIHKHTSFEELTSPLLREFVEKIVVHEAEALDEKRWGKLRRQEIEIYYSFVDKIELPDT